MGKESTFSRVCLFAPFHSSGLCRGPNTVNSTSRPGASELTYFKTGGSTPWDDYTYVGQMTDEWSIDGSVLRFSDYGNWLMFSCLHGVTYQSICMQKLSSSYTTLTGDIYVISSPTESFETNGYPVNEAPAALYYGGVTYISYAASYCWTADYCIGLLAWDGSTAPSDASAWTKHDGCVFSSANGNYGTASNGFFQSPTPARHGWCTTPPAARRARVTTRGILWCSS